jgi:glycerol-3-phosphate dehydrogenase subunit B
MATSESHDVLVIGGGLTGLAAARRARQLGLSVLVVASTRGSLPLSSGALDLLGVYPTRNRRTRDRPWGAISELLLAEPGHPYGLLGLKRVRDAWEDFVGYLERGPLRYFRQGEQNLALVTAAGTLKPTCAVPASMKNNVLAWQGREPTLVLGPRRLVDFSPEQVQGNLRGRWPRLRAARLPIGELLPDRARVTPAALALEFEKPAFRQRFADAAAPHLLGERFLGLPAVLGLDNAAAICAELEERLGVAVFEIPLLSPSLPGARLADLLRRDLQRQGVTLDQGRTIVALHSQGGRVTGAVRQGSERRDTLQVRRGVVLASGRFLGGGLAATPGGVRATLLDLDLDVPPRRDDWHMDSFLGAPGHPINRVGLQTDRQLRPLDPQGRPLHKNLHAAGAVLADHDWVREKSGAGTSITTGYAAAEQLADAGVVN